MWAIRLIAASVPGLVAIGFLWAAFRQIRARALLRGRFKLLSVLNAVHGYQILELRPCADTVTSDSAEMTITHFDAHDPKSLLGAVAVRMRRHVAVVNHLFGTIACALPLLAHAQFAPVERTDFDPAGLRTIALPSVTCAGVWNTPAFACRPVTLPVYLAQSPSGKHTALVVISHGSGGLDKRHSDYARSLASAGIDAAVIDHWTPRGVTKVHFDYNAAREKGAHTQSIAIDAMVVAGRLKAMPQWNDAKLGYIGESMGGGAVIHATRPFISKIVEQATGLSAPAWAAAVALYPGCFERSTLERFQPVPMLIVIGEMDTDVPAEVCAKQAQWMNARGGTVEVQVLAGEFHDFDAPSPVAYSARAQNPAGCSSLRDGDRLILESSGKAFPATPQGLAAMQSECMTRGVTSGNRGNPKTGYDRWIEFFKGRLLQ
ncbi:dienelactone hydrolase family protein [Caenimonas terrae]|uniref:Dienelactone hydrolase family protein n=1 Tax=Caenimonas terrae TaxID=696074 RepID=A0ABW0NJ91_9BURK